MSTTVQVSFEFFPPNDDAMAEHLWAAVERRAPLQPEFVSVTYGADGSTRSRTHACVLRMLRETGLLVAPHLTCVGASREEVMAIAEDYWRHGVRHMVALRGDAAGGNAPGAALPSKPAAVTSQPFAPGSRCRMPRLAQLCASQDRRCSAAAA